MCVVWRWIVYAVAVIPKTPYTEHAASSGRGLRELGAELEPAKGDGDVKR